MNIYGIYIINKEMGVFMKKIICGMILAIILSLSIGCSKKIDEQPKDLNNLSYIGNLTGTIEKNIILTNNYLLVSDDNEVYRVSFDKMFSSGSNFKRMELTGLNDIRIIGFEKIYSVDGGVLLFDEDKRLWYCNVSKCNLGDGEEYFIFNKKQLK